MLHDVVVGKTHVCCDVMQDSNCLYIYYFGSHASFVLISSNIWLFIIASQSFDIFETVLTTAGRG